MHLEPFRNRFPTAPPVALTLDSNQFILFRLDNAAAAYPPALAIWDLTQAELVHAALGRLLDQARPYPKPGSTIPDQPGYVVGVCEHRVARSEWLAGCRTCERCPAAPQGGTGAS